MSPQDGPQSVRERSKWIQTPASLPLGWNNLRLALYCLPEGPSRDHLFTAVSCSWMCLLLSSFPSIPGSAPLSLNRASPDDSQINDWHSRPLVRVCFWGNPTSHTVNATTEDPVRTIPQWAVTPLYKVRGTLGRQQRGCIWITLMVDRAG